MTNKIPGKLYWVYFVGFCLILALPLLNLPPWFSPPDWGKTIIFRIILSILIFVFLWQIFSQKQFQIKTSLSFWLLIVLFSVFFLATIFSLDPYFSFWGSPYRSGGFLNFAFYIIFAILAFLILRKSDWQKIWNFAILVGISVSIVAIFQQFGLISKIFISFETRPPSTVGGPIFLAIYLLLLSFLALSFGIKDYNPPTTLPAKGWAPKNLFKKLFYFLSFLLFFFVAVFITQTRAVIIGYMVGFLFFIFFYPVRKFSISLGLKLTALFFLILGIYGIYFVNTQTELPQFIQKNKFLNGVTARLSIKAGLTDPRISGWKVAKQAIMDRPILGYGPENFSIGFDKFYDPSLPQITREWGSWWDRAHNFIFDIGVTAGIPALIIYLSLFGVLFFQLQKLKNAEINADNYADRTLIAHGIQATFIGYLVANFFSFDTFSTYLISFLLIGYSLHLISSGTAEQFSVIQRINQRSALNQRRYQRWFSDKTLVTRIYLAITKYRKSILIICLVLLVWFIWDFNLKPFQINKEINIALHESKVGFCERALARMENVLPTKTFLNNYLRLKYIDITDKCIEEKPEMAQPLSQKAFEILKENIKIRPYYTRNWLLIGSYTNMRLEKESQPEGVRPSSAEGLVEGLKEEANYYFERAYELSPKRQETFIEWIKTDLLTAEYQKAKEKAQKCLDLNPAIGDCWWLKGLSEIYLGEVEKAQEDIKSASQKGYFIDSKASLLQLAKVYGNTKNYQELVEIYQKLIILEPSNAQYYASLAFCYKELGDIENAKKQALKVLELMPEAKEDVERFLEELSY